MVREVGQHRLYTLPLRCTPSWNRALEKQTRTLQEMEPKHQLISTFLALITQHVCPPPG